MSRPVILGCWDGPRVLGPEGLGRAIPWPRCGERPPPQARVCCPQSSYHLSFLIQLRVWELQGPWRTSWMGQPALTPGQELPMDISPWIWLVIPHWTHLVRWPGAQGLWSARNQVALEALKGLIQLPSSPSCSPHGEHFLNIWKCHADRSHTLWPGAGLRPWESFYSDPVSLQPHFAGSLLFPWCHVPLSFCTWTKFSGGEWKHVLESEVGSNEAPAAHKVCDFWQVTCPLEPRFPHLSNGNDDIGSLSCYEN